MAEARRMTAEQVVSYLLEEEGVDLLRESLRWVAQRLMEVELSELAPDANEPAPLESLTGGVLATQTCPSAIIAIEDPPWRGLPRCACSCSDRAGRRGCHGWRPTE